MMDYKHLLKGISLVLFLTLFVHADMKTTYVSRTDAMMNMPEQITTYTVYVRGDKVRMDIEGKFNLYYNDTEKSFTLVYPVNRQYSKVVFSKVKHLVDMSSEMLGTVKYDTKNIQGAWKVGKWNTFAKEISLKTKVFEMNMRIDFTKDVKIYKSLMNLYLEMSKFQGGMGEYSKEIINTDGYPVKFSGLIKMSGQEFKTETLTQEIQELPLDDSLFIIPDDYKEMPLNLNDFRVALQ